MDFMDECFEILKDLCRRFTAIDIVAAGAEENHPGLIGKNDSFRELSGIGDLGAAESAINHRFGWEVLGEGFPKTDGGGADKEDGCFGRRIGKVDLLEGRDFAFPSSEIVR